MATKRDPRVRMSPAYAMSKRVLRNPQHRFSLQTRPYQLQPFMIAPVLPGETMKNLLLQARVVTHPLSPDLRLVGWWNEYYFFYVKHRDLPEDVRPLLTAMVLDPATNVDALRDDDGNAKTYCFPGGIDYTQLALERITEEYFRDEGEDWDAGTLDGLPMVQIYGKGHNDWMDSLTLDGDKRTDADMNLIEDGVLTPNEFIDRMTHWQTLRDAGLTEMDYDDFVSTYGGKTREDEESPNLHRPELLRYSRNWQYPTNIVEPTTGVPASAVAWSIAERADKDRRFNEPGFIVGLTCARPKMYIGKQLGALAGGLDSVYSWLPAALHQNFESAYKKFAADEGPLANVFQHGTAPVVNDPYWVDMRDLYVYGDQFVNYTMAKGTVALPTALNQRRYAAGADIDALFSEVGNNKLLHDGVVNLGIAGRQRPTTPGTTI